MNFQCSRIHIIITKFVGDMYFVKLHRKRSESEIQCIFFRVGNCTNCSNP